MTTAIVTSTQSDTHTFALRLRRPPHNFFSYEMIAAIADQLELLDLDDRCRCVLLCAEGKNFCAGADFSTSSPNYTTSELYEAAVRLFRTRKPIVAAINGSAVGGGLGLALAADFRVASNNSKFSANFARLGFHHGFGLSVTLPRLVGQQRAAEMLFTGRRVSGDEAVAIGLADKLATDDVLQETALAIAREISLSAPLAVESIRSTLRGDLAERIELATQHEMAEQLRLRSTADFAEGSRAVSERRDANFQRE